MVRIILRSLPERFYYKVAAIEEARGLKSLTKNELIDTLRTFEMGLRENKSYKKKNLAFKISWSNDVDKDNPNLQEMAESITLLTRLFNKKFNKRKKSEGSSSTIPTEKNKSDKSPKCFECGWYGHIKRERANLFKYQKINKNFFDVSNSDNETEESGHEESEENDHIVHVAIMDL